MNLFEQILKDLSVPMGVALHADTLSSCTVIWQEKATFQMELDRRLDNLICGMKLGEIAPGAYREKLFKEALKLNNMPPPLPGILAFSTKVNQLLIFLKFPAKEVKGDILMARLHPFIETGNLWQVAISQGQIPARTPQPVTTGNSGLFGLTP